MAVLNLLILNVPPRVQREECCWGPVRRNVFPFLLAQIVSTLEKECEVEFFDANCDNATFQDIKEMLRRRKPDAVVCSLTPQYMPLEARISKICVNNGVKYIGIPVPFDYAEEVVSKYDFYFAIYSEPEKTLLDYCKGESLETLKGIIYKTNDQLLVNPPQRPCYSKCPPINWDRFDLSRYDKSDFMVQIARGCPYSCKFCIWANKPWQIKPVETVLTDLENLERCGVRTVYLLCAQITTNKRWLYNFCEEKKKRGIEILWRTDIRANEINRDIIRLMRESSCIGVYMGVESFNQQLLDAIDKRLTVKEILDAIKICNEEGMPLRFPLMFNIGETESQTREYVSYIKKARVATVDTGIAMAYRGTRFFQELDAKQNVKILDMGIVPIPTLNDVTNAQMRLKLFRKEMKKLFINRLVSKVWWIITNKKIREVYFTVLKKGGIRVFIYSLISLFH